jgi:hypothetical protein
VANTPEGPVPKERVTELEKELARKEKALAEPECARGNETGEFHNLM